MKTAGGHISCEAALWGGGGGGHLTSLALPDPLPTATRGKGLVD